MLEDLAVSFRLGAGPSSACWSRSRPQPRSSIAPRWWPPCSRCAEAAFGIDGGHAVRSGEATVVTPWCLCCVTPWGYPTQVGIRQLYSVNLGFGQTPGHHLPFDCVIPVQPCPAISVTPRYPVFCLSLEESVGVPWAMTCALLLVAVICHSDPTYLAFVWANRWISNGA